MHVADDATCHVLEMGMKQTTLLRVKAPAENKDKGKSDTFECLSRHMQAPTTAQHSTAQQIKNHTHLADPWACSSKGAASDNHILFVCCLLVLLSRT